MNLPLRTEWTSIRSRLSTGFYCGGKSMVKKGYSRVPIDSDHHLRISIHLLGGDENYPILEIHGDIRSDTNRHRIGYVHGYVMCAIDVDYNLERLFWICDRHDQGLCQLSSDLIDAKFPLKRICSGGELFYFQAIELLPQWQGKRFGTKVIGALFKWLKRYHEIAIIVMYPHPLQYTHPFESHLASTETTEVYYKSLEKLRHYYRSNFGSKPITKDSFLYVLKL